VCRVVDTGALEQVSLARFPTGKRVRGSYSRPMFATPPFCYVTARTHIAAFMKPSERAVQAIATSLGK
jgi:hypothetical protein